MKHLGLACTLALAAGCGSAKAPTAGGAPLVLAPSGPLDLAWDVFGDTPSVAWSPDGSKLAVTHGTRYYPSEPDRTRAGIEVLDVASGRRAFAARALAYHPVWLGDGELAFGCSPYECGDDNGLYAVALGAAPRPLVRGGVYHPLPSTSAATAALVYHGFGDPLVGTDGAAHEDTGWYAVDRAGRIGAFLGRGSEDVMPGPSWSPPPGAAGSQCPTSTQGRSVQQRGGDVVIRDGAGERVIARVDPWTVGTDGPNGSVLTPCLSPRGDYVVYFSAGPEQIHVAKIR